MGNPFNYEFIHWFLFDSDTEIEVWFTEIAKTIPEADLPEKEGTIPDNLLTRCINFRTPPSCDPSVFATEKLGKVLLDHGFGSFFMKLQKNHNYKVKVTAS